MNQFELIVGCWRRFASLPAKPTLRAKIALNRQQPLGRIRVLGHVYPRIVLETGRVAEVQA